MAIKHIFALTASFSIIMPAAQLVQPSLPAATHEVTTHINPIKSMLHSPNFLTRLLDDYQSTTNTATRSTFTSFISDSARAEEPTKMRKKAHNHRIKHRPTLWPIPEELETAAVITATVPAAATLVAREMLAVAQTTGTLKSMTRKLYLTTSAMVRRRDSAYVDFDSLSESSFAYSGLAHAAQTSDGQFYYPKSTPDVHVSTSTTTIPFVRTTVEASTATSSASEATVTVDVLGNAGGKLAARDVGWLVLAALAGVGAIFIAVL